MGPRVTEHIASTAGEAVGRHRRLILHVGTEVSGKGMQDEGLCATNQEGWNPGNRNRIEKNQGRHWFFSTPSYEYPLPSTEGKKTDDANIKVNK